MRVEVSDISLNISDDGPPNAPAVVFAHPLGLDLRVWDAVCTQLPKNLRLVRYDARGHGASDVPPAPYRMGQLVTDAEQVLDALTIKDAVFVGAGYGGLVAQGLAVKRLDQLRAMVLCGTAAKLSPPATWDHRIQQIKTGGMDAAANILAARSFTRSGRDTPKAQSLTDVLRHTPPEGYIASCNAISGTDFYTPTSGLRLPSLGLCGIDDRISPPDLMRETIELIPGAQFKLIRRSGHYPMIESPEVFADYLCDFLKGIGHL